MSGTPTGSVEFFDGSTDLGPGTALSGSGDAVTSTFSIATLTAGTHTIRAVYMPTGAFQATSGSLSQTVDPDTPTITWNPPADIVHGTPLSSTQLRAAAGWTIGGSPVTVAGTFTYTPPPPRSCTRANTRSRSTSSPVTPLTTTRRPTRPSS